MDEIERKRIKEVRDLLSSVDLKLLELLKTESKETFMTQEVISKKPDNPTLGDGIPMDAKLPATDSDEIIWIYHNNKKYKTCKYKCGNYVGWDDYTKKYIHYDAEFKLIGADCPKYGGN